MKYIAINNRVYDKPKLLANRDGVFIFDDEDALKEFLLDLENVALADCLVYKIDPKAYQMILGLEEI